MVATKRRSVGRPRERLSSPGTGAQARQPPHAGPRGFRAGGGTGGCRRASPRVQASASRARGRRPAGARARHGPPDPARVELPNAQAGVGVSVTQGTGKGEHRIEDGHSVGLRRPRTSRWNASARATFIEAAAPSEGSSSGPSGGASPCVRRRQVGHRLGGPVERHVAPLTRSPSICFHSRSACGSVRRGTSSKSSGDNGTIAATRRDPRMRTTCSPRSAASTRAFSLALASRMVTVCMHRSWTLGESLSRSPSWTSSKGSNSRSLGRSQGTPPAGGRDPEPAGGLGRVALDAGSAAVRRPRPGAHARAGRGRGGNERAAPRGERGRRDGGERAGRLGGEAVAEPSWGGSPRGGPARGVHAAGRRALARFAPLLGRIASRTAARGDRARVVADALAAARAVADAGRGRGTAAGPAPAGRAPVGRARAARRSSVGGGPRTWTTARGGPGGLRPARWSPSRPMAGGWRRAGSSPASASGRCRTSRGRPSTGAATTRSWPRCTPGRTVRAVKDPQSPTGWKLEPGPFPGWAKLPPVEVRRGAEGP